MKLTRAVIAAMLLTLLGSTPAFADLTGFVGANMTPSNRLVRGVSAGAGILVVGVEFEYAKTLDDTKAAAPELTTGMGSVLLQTPFAILGFQPYFTTGAGPYRERLGTLQHTGFGFNTGGGVKISLVGPLRLRVDYRVFKLGSGALNSPAHRIYAGLNLKF
jgi:opacity protein-like surface antigen